MISETIALLLTVGSLPSANLASQRVVPTTLEGITLADSGKIFLPIREACEALGLPIGIAENGRVQIANIKLAAVGLALPSGVRLMPIRFLSRWGASIEWVPEVSKFVVSRRGKEFYVKSGDKRVIIEKSIQRLTALQGSRTVLRTRISTGREGYATPNGNFAAGLKLRFNTSNLFSGAPMPFSVQVKDDIYIHGHANATGRPASHGCIRLPLNGPAEFFFAWVEHGTPIKVTGKWKR